MGLFIFTNDLSDCNSWIKVHIKVEILFIFGDFVVSFSPISILKKNKSIKSGIKYKQIKCGRSLT